MTAAATTGLPELSEATRTALETAHANVLRTSWRARAMPWIIVASALLYVAYAIWYFDLGVLTRGGKWDRGASYMADWVSYEIRPQLRFDGARINVTFGRFDPVGPNPNPDWITRNSAGHVTVEFGAADQAFTATPDRYVVRAGTETYTIARTPEKLAEPAAPLPVWLEYNRGSYRALYGINGYVDFYENRIAARRRYLGWANFWFDPGSSFWAMTTPQFVDSLVSGPRVDPAQSNASLALTQFLENSEWQHGDVYTKLLQTIVMAFVGTLFAFVVGVPLAFLAARNITRSTLVNQIIKRFFDFLRSMDMLIWALFFTRGFGQGPIAGIAAIFFTDTGSLGKLATEALENVDSKQQEGLRSVGASPLQVQRYGVVPQVLPVIASQALYHWESNTRSATIIGAMGAGGIGLKLLEAMRTNQDWENVAYMVLLILGVVYIFDGLSTWLRRRLIAG